MKNILILIIFVFWALPLPAQTGKVGIKTTNPQETLDVNGSSYANSLYLRNPGEPTSTGGHFLASNSNNLQIYDPNSGNSALFNYIKLVLTNVTKDGVADFDTKIDSSKFQLVIHNYSFQAYDTATNTSTVDVALDYGNNGINDDKQGSPEVVAFVSGGTWHIKARFTNSVIVKYATTGHNNFNIELYMVAYKYLISKSNFQDTTININGTDGSTITLTPPTGF